MCNKMCDVSDFVKRCYCKYYTLGRIRSPKDYNNSGYECDFFSHILMNNAIFRKNMRYTRKSHMKNYHWSALFAKTKNDLQRKKYIFLKLYYNLLIKPERRIHECINSKIISHLLAHLSKIYLMWAFVIVWICTINISASKTTGWIFSKLEGMILIWPFLCTC